MKPGWINIIMTLILLSGCSVKQRPIEYGTDECAYCKMIIMDHRFGSELVTSKGKVFVFDAAECLADFLHYDTAVAMDAELLLVTPYTHPDMLIHAEAASFLVSGNMPSPMGAYLNAFQDEATARSFQEEKGGKVYTWDEIAKNIKSIRLNAIKEYE